MDYIESYKDSKKGKTCAVLGGGTSLPYDLYDLPDVDVLFGVNQHSAILKPDYTVFLDTALWPYIRDYKTTFICRESSVQSNTADLDKRSFIICRDVPDHRYSGSLALKAADYMGFSKIYVCGMDQYDGFGEEDARYWWWEANHTPQRRKDRKNHNTPDELASFIRHLRQPGNIYFMSGRMKDLHQ